MHLWLALALLVLTVACQPRTVEKWTTGPGTERKLFFDFRQPSGAASAAGNPDNCGAHIAKVQGSFTAPDRMQVAHLLRAQDCLGPSSQGYELAVLEGDRTISRLQVSAEAILAKVRVMPDGRDHLLLTRWSRLGGIKTQHALLAGYLERDLKVIEDYGRVREDTCESGLPDRAITALVLYSLPGEGGEIARTSAVRYRASCDEPDEWQKVEQRSDGK